MGKFGLLVKNMTWLVGLGVIILCPTFSYGEENNILNKFDVTPVESSAQFDKKVSYFDLLLKPNQKETITVIVTNDQDKDLSLNLSVNPAITNANGVVEYAGDKQVGTDIAPYTITDLVSIKDTTLTLKPKEKREVPIEINMPDKKFPGVVAGAIYVSEIPEGKAEGNIRNILSREIAILLRTEETPVTPEIKFKDAKGIHTNQRNAIEVNMENVSPTYIKHVSIAYDITYEGKEFFSGKQDNLKIAPSSLFPFSISLDGKEFESGDYKAKVTVTSEDYKWEDTLPFKIEKDQAKELNNNAAIDENPEPFPWMTVILVAVLIAFVVLAFYLIRKNRKLHEKLSEKNTSKSGRKRKKSSASKKQNRTKK